MAKRKRKQTGPNQQTHQQVAAELREQRPRLAVRYLGRHPHNTQLHQIMLVADRVSMVFTVVDGTVPQVMREVGKVIDQFTRHLAITTGASDAP